MPGSGSKPSIAKSAKEETLKALPKDSPKTASQPQGWKCPRSYPQLHPGLEGHLYTRPSRLGYARWKHAELVVGTKQWYEANAMSYKRHALHAGRDEWVPSASGAVHGNLSLSGAPRWPDTRHSSQGPFTAKASLYLQPRKGQENLLALNGSQSLPSLEIAQSPYPPSPAFIRDFMRRVCSQESQ
ncbi:unnamed protein product [Effrenium voratum]|uniref:Uncharacterized protein n=1 Tax=Effrenium voratum TaxID=2562239 RepID=A0AA36IF18_9DINO|nr:unnamed protein product [Effrenium voratum]|mmetsp:Transcript_58782/g.139967  ORF Transcript_58782/g.139967 Transcript_58782/m.139967 type:complete len:185 (-) Transcript_58782:83-637(-)|eukprot:CAMPEP_0181402104 /NCGR_PEP_ID=MMETSP1110-20121109/3003_1 /TAXON_ID=174948 /ORGANISM="Symbiodinium sp., Strain CCMP421" /LENGTH=184 /DNA_ID=CAMNT_0023524313 /DNA_START=31 /DNA_END=585 /DNA_ORIENTATION=+